MFKDTFMVAGYRPAPTCRPRLTRTTSGTMWNSSGTYPHSIYFPYVPVPRPLYLESLTPSPKSLSLYVPTSSFRPSLKPFIPSPPILGPGFRVGRCPPPDLGSTPLNPPTRDFRETETSESRAEVEPEDGV